MAEINAPIVFKPRFTWELREAATGRVKIPCERCKIVHYRDEPHRFCDLLLVFARLHRAAKERLAIWILRHLG